MPQEPVPMCVVHLTIPRLIRHADYKYTLHLCDARSLSKYRLQVPTSKKTQRDLVKHQ